MSERADAIIIGAGIIGAAIAFELSKKGYRTLSIDRNPAAGYGPTSASCAIIRVHYSTFAGTAFAYEGYFYWKEWARYLGVEDERGLATYRETGCMVMRTAANDYLSRHTDICRQLDIPFEIWDAQRIREKMPVYDLKSYAPPRRMDDERFGEANEGRVESAVYFPTAGYVTDPQLATHNLQRAAEAHGARFVFGRRVTAIDKDRGGRASGVRLDDGSPIHAPIVINVAGPHSAKVNAMAGALDDMTIATRALKQEVVHLPAPGGFDMEAAGLVVSDSDIGCYSRPEHGNHVLVGSEDPVCDPREWVDPDLYDENFSDQWTVQAYRYAQRVPALQVTRQMKGVVSLYDVSDDWIPIYDRSSVPGYYMAVGSSGNQFKNAPVAGAMMAALVEYCEAGNDHDATPLQFDLPRVGRSIDVGFYSRKREVNEESSFSVLG